MLVQPSTCPVVDQASPFALEYERRRTNIQVCWNSAWFIPMDPAVCCVPVYFLGGRLKILYHRRIIRDVVVLRVHVSLQMNAELKLVHDVLGYTKLPTSM